MDSRKTRQLVVDSLNKAIGERSPGNDSLFSSSSMLNSRTSTREQPQKKLSEFDQNSNFQFSPKFPEIPKVQNLKNSPIGILPGKIPILACNLLNFMRKIHLRTE